MRYVLPYTVRPSSSICVGEVQASFQSDARPDPRSTPYLVPRTPVLIVVVLGIVHAVESIVSYYSFNKCTNVDACYMSPP